MSMFSTSSPSILSALLKWLFISFVQSSTGALCGKPCCTRFASGGNVTSCNCGTFDEPPPPAPHESPPAFFFFAPPHPPPPSHPAAAPPGATSPVQSLVNPG